MTTSQPFPSPTGRLNKSEPEIQHFPGTPQAEAQRRRMKAALPLEGHRFIDLSSLEDRAAAAELHKTASGSGLKY